MAIPALALLGLGAGSSLLGGLLGSGRKVRVPEYKPLDIAGEQQAAVRQNIQQLPQASELARKTAEADQGTLEAMLRRAIPGYDKLLQQQSSLLQAQLSGELPQDVTQAVMRSGAARALGAGLGGGQLGRNLTLRDLGLTSMGMQQQGFANALNFIQSQRQTGMVNPMSAASMFISPQQRIGLRQQENQMQYQQQLMSAQVAAQPNPMLAALGGTLSSFGGIAAGYGMGGMMRPYMGAFPMPGMQTPYTYQPTPGYPVGMNPYGT